MDWQRDTSRFWENGTSKLLTQFLLQKFKKCSFPESLKSSLGRIFHYHIMCTTFENGNDCSRFPESHRVIFLMLYAFYRTIKCQYILGVNVREKVIVN